MNAERITLQSGATPIFTIRGLLNADECAAEIRETERAGYGDAPITTARGFVMAKGVRNNTRVMVDDPARARWLFERARPWLPATLGGEDELVGLNERFRFYRYEPGQYFRWHTDGSYARTLAERSLLTLLVYLNDDFEGGATEFARDGAVQPERGAALVFAHGHRHQGAPVVRGAKYVMRTDVMYRDPRLADRVARRRERPQLTR
ncbi:MAG: 2OG-Fe(II) oxygenase [Myxococcales bacterium]|nr:2OG-Fe(II) oxygenase [Myxococcales bacterium]